MAVGGETGYLVVLYGLAEDGLFLVCVMFLSVHVSVGTLCCVVVYTAFYVPVTSVATLSCARAWPSFLCPAGLFLCVCPCQWSPAAEWGMTGGMPACRDDTIHCLSQNLISAPVGVSSVYLLSARSVCVWLQCQLRAV